MQALGPHELRALRLQKGPSQKLVADKLGVAAGLYSAYEMPGSGKALPFERMVEHATTFALGEPSADELEPRWLVCRLELASGQFVPVLESYKRRRLERLPVFNDVAVAGDIAAMVAERYPLSGVRPIPAWHQFVLESLARYRLPADEWYLADEVNDRSRLATALTMGLRLVRSRMAEIEQAT